MKTAARIDELFIVFDGLKFSYKLKI
jgi:hypothetical protein